MGQEGVFHETGSLASVCAAKVSSEYICNHYECQSHSMFPLEAKRRSYVLKCQYGAVALEECPMSYTSRRYVAEYWFVHCNAIPCTSSTTSRSSKSLIELRPKTPTPATRTGSSLEFSLIVQCSTVQYHSDKECNHIIRNGP